MQIVTQNLYTEISRVLILFSGTCTLIAYFFGVQYLLQITGETVTYGADAGVR